MDTTERTRTTEETVKIRRTYKVEIIGGHDAQNITRFTRVSIRPIGREIKMLWIEFPTAKRIELRIAGAR